MNIFEVVLLLVIIVETAQYDAVFKAEPSWDIYSGGVYRYGEY